jgi:hypothetical protein
MVPTRFPFSPSKVTQVGYDHHNSLPFTVNPRINDSDTSTVTMKLVQMPISFRSQAVLAGTRMLVEQTCFLSITYACCVKLDASGRILRAATAPSPGPAASCSVPPWHLG